LGGSKIVLASSSPQRELDHDPACESVELLRHHLDEPPFV
jgi:hypothetical protein